MDKGIDIWFPSVIYWADNVISTEENEILKKYCLHLNVGNSEKKDWNCNVQTTHGTIDFRKNGTFATIFNQINQHVADFAEAHKSHAEYTCNSAWINVNRSDHYQEFHVHNGSIISGIYYISAPKGSGDTVFKSPAPEDMLPLKNITKENKFTYEIARYAPVERRLLLFRSFMPHMVCQGTNIQERITLALNYN